MPHHAPCGRACSGATVRPDGRVAHPRALANAPLVHELCERFAERVVAYSRNDAQRLQFAYLLAFGRMPRVREIHRLLPFVEGAEDERATWFDAMHALLNTTEFRFRR